MPLMPSVRRILPFLTRLPAHRRAVLTRRDRSWSLLDITCFVAVGWYLMCVLLLLRLTKRLDPGVSVRNWLLAAFRLQRKG